jgi:hypothetical protein
MRRLRPSSSTISASALPIECNLTNDFSKKVENHAAAVALYFMCYNFVRIHQALRVFPAMAAGVTGKLWSVYDIVALVEQREAEAKKNSN